MNQQDYEKAKAECWEEYIKLGGNNNGNLAPFNIVFRRAYALGKQSEDVKEFDVSDLMVKLMHLRKEALNHIVYALMLSGKIAYHEIMDMYIEYLKELEQGKSDKLTDLRNKVIEMWVDKDADYGKNLKGIMHYLVDEKMINCTHEEIDRK